MENNCEGSLSSPQWIEESDYSDEVTVVHIMAPCAEGGNSFLPLSKNQILKIKGKESENSYQELKRSRKGQAHTNTRKLNRDISTGTAVFLNQKRVNVCEHTTKTASLESLRKVPPGGCERDGWREII